MYKGIFRFFAKGWKGTGARAFSSGGKTWAKIKSSKFVVGTGNFIKRNWDTLAIYGGMYAWDVYSSSGQEEGAPAPDVAATIAMDSVNDTILSPSIIALITNDIIDVRAVVNSIVSAATSGAGALQLRFVTLLSLLNSMLTGILTCQLLILLMLWLDYVTSC